MKETEDGLSRGDRVQILLRMQILVLKGSHESKGQKMKGKRQQRKISNPQVQGNHQGIHFGVNPQAGGRLTVKGMTSRGVINND